MTPASGRWSVLVGFVLVALVTQLLWLNFAPLLVDMQHQYGVDELTASLLVLPFPLLYVFLSIPSGRLIDVYGYRKVVGMGALVTALGSLIRLDTAHFASLVVGQVVIALAQPFVVNGINKLVADWFEEEEVALSTGLGTVGMFLGMAIGMASTPALVTAVGMQVTMALNSGVAFAVAIAWYFLGKERGVAEAENPSPFGDLLKNRRLLLMVGLALMGLGYFNGLTTWLEQLLAPRGLNAEQAGVVGGVIVVGGIVGAVVVPTLADHYHVRRLPLLLCVIAAGVANGALMLTQGYMPILGVGAALGFFFMPAFALLLAMTGEVVDKRDGGAATGLVMLAGNGGGVVVILALAAMDDWAGLGPWMMLVVLTVLTMILAWMAPETWKEPETRKES